MDFAGDLALVEVGGKWGWINKSGGMAIAPDYDLAFAFSDGLALVKAAKRYFYIDQTGDVVLDADLKRIKRRNRPAGKPFNGYLNSNKKRIVFRPRFEMAQGIAYVMVNGTEALIDPLGRYIWIPTP